MTWTEWIWSCALLCAYLTTWQWKGDQRGVGSFSRSRNDRKSNKNQLKDRKTGNIVDIRYKHRHTLPNLRWLGKIVWPLYITLISTNFQDPPQRWKLCWQTSPSKIPHCCLHQSEARKLSSWPELTNRRAGWRVHHLGKGWLWWWLWHCSSSTPPPPPHPPTSSNCWHSFEQNFRVLRTFDSNDD